jgi:hypothetical protein
MNTGKDLDWQFTYVKDMLIRRARHGSEETFFLFRRYAKPANSQILANWEAMNYSQQENYLNTREEQFFGEIIIHEGKLSYTREGEYGDSFRVRERTGTGDNPPMPNMPYIIFFSDNTQVEGITDENGLIPYQSRNHPTFYKVKIFLRGKER